MAYGSGAGRSDVTGASKDEGRQPRFVVEPVKNAIELYMGIFVLGRKVAKSANTPTFLLMLKVGNTYQRCVLVQSPVVPSVPPHSI
jgi:hypothetical protein